MSILRAATTSIAQTMSIKSYTPSAQTRFVVILPWFSGYQPFPYNQYNSDLHCCVHAIHALAQRVLVAPCLLTEVSAIQEREIKASSQTKKILLSEGA